MYNRKQSMVMDSGPYPNGRSRFYMATNESKFYNFLEDALKNSDVAYEILQMRNNTLEVFRKIKKNGEMKYVVEPKNLLSTDIGYLTQYNNDLVDCFTYNIDGDIESICWNKISIETIKDLMKYGNELNMCWGQVCYYHGFLSSLRNVLTREAYNNKDLKDKLDEILYATEEDHS